MNNDFDRMIKNIEDELLALKTSSEYSSIRSANYSYSSTVRTGYYKITYQNTLEPIFSLVFVGNSSNTWGLAYSRTPENSTQVVEVNTDYIDSQGNVQTASVPIAVLSNVSVLNIVRLS